MNRKVFYDPGGTIEHGGSVSCMVLERQPGGYLIEFGRSGMRGLLISREVLHPHTWQLAQFQGFQSGMAVFHYLSPASDEEPSPGETSRRARLRSRRRYEAIIDLAPPAQEPLRRRIVDHRPDAEGSLVQSILASLKQVLWPILQS